MQRYRITLRDFFWLTLTVALAIAWFLDHTVAWNKVDDQRNAMKKFKVETLRSVREYRIAHRDEEIRELEAENTQLKFEIEEFKKALFGPDYSRK